MSVTPDSSASPEASDARLWLIALALVGLSFMSALSLTSPCYETNDDVLFMWIADGTLYGEPGADLPYQSVLIAEAIAGLYRITSALPWYGLYLLSAHALAWLLIARSLLGTTTPIKACGATLAAFSVVGLPLITRLQFTSASVVLGLSGAFYFAAMRRERRGRAHLALAGVVCALAGMMRPHKTMAAVVAFGGLFLLYDLARHRRLKDLLPFLIAGGVLYGGSAIVDSARYDRDPRWVRWWKVQRASHAITTIDLSYSPAMYQGLAEVGWSINDLELTAALFRTTDPMYGPETLTRVADVVRREKSPTKYRRTRKELRRQLLAEQRPWLIALLAGALLIAAVGDLRALALLVVYSAAWFFLLTGIAHIFGTMPDRVLRPLLFAPLMVIPPGFSGAGRSSLSAGPGWSRSLRVAAALTAAAGLAGAALWSWVDEVSGAAARVERREQLEDEFAKLKRIDPEGLFLRLGVTNLNALSPLQTRRFEEPRFLMFGWAVETPQWRQALRDNKLEDLAMAMVERPDVYLLAPPYFKRSLSIYIKEHYQKDLETRTLDELCEGKIHILKLSFAKSEPSDK